MKKIPIFLAIFAMLMTFTLANFVPQAEAACSYNGLLHSNGQCAKSYKNNNFNNIRFERPEVDDNRIAYLQAYIERLLALLEQLENDGDIDNDDASVDVITLAETEIETDEALLRGEIDFNNQDTAIVYFEYSRDRNDLDRETTHISIDDEDETVFTRRLTNLSDNSVYYFRAVAQDDNGDIDRGAIRSFRTDSDASRGEEPDATTDKAKNVTEDSAALHGSVDMNDFNNGFVFFVYGEDEDQIDEVMQSNDTYADIDEDGNNLHKVAVDNDLDSQEDYQVNIENLDPSTDIYFGICVEFEDEDNDEKLICGETESLKTDN